MGHHITLILKCWVKCTKDVKLHVKTRAPSLIGCLLLFVVVCCCLLLFVAVLGVEWNDFISFLECWLSGLGYFIVEVLRLGDFM